MGGRGSDRERNVKDANKRWIQVLQAFYEYEMEQGRPPTVREVGQRVRLNSPGATAYHIRRLREDGYLERIGDGARGLRISEKGKRIVATPFDARVVDLPLLGYIRAGEPIPAPGSGMVSENPFSDETVSVPANLIDRTDNLFVLRVKGDSMIDALVADGDYVVLRVQSEANPGDMVAVWLEDEESTTLKYIYPREGGEVELRPANPNYDPIVKPERDVRVNGKVVAVLRSLERQEPAS